MNPPSPSSSCFSVSLTSAGAEACGAVDTDVDTALALRLPPATNGLLKASRRDTTLTGPRPFTAPSVWFVCCTMFAKAWGVSDRRRRLYTHAKLRRKRLGIRLVHLPPAREHVLQLGRVRLVDLFLERVGRFVLVRLECSEVLCSFGVSGRSISRDRAATYDQATKTERSLMTACLDSSRIDCWCSVCV